MSRAPAPGEGATADADGYSRGRLLLYFLRLGTVGFGGPIALVGRMEKELVESRRWLSKEEYLRGLALAQLAPGPLAAQLAMYIGYVKQGVPGATLVGVAFILPSFVMVVALGMLYVAWGGLAWMQALFYGIGAAVIGIITKSAYKLARTTVGNSRLLLGIFIVMCSVTAVTEHEYAWLFVVCGVAALLVLAPPQGILRHFRGTASSFGFFAMQIPALTAAPPVRDIFLFFATAGAFVFGSGLAIVPFLHGSVVQQFHWLNERQFLDAVAVAMITPGPVVITVGFIGYLVGNLPGACAAAVGVFLPVWLVVVICTPLYEKFAANRHVAAFVRGVTAAASGAIAGAVIVLGRRAITDIPTALIGAATLGILIRYKVPEPIIVAVAGGIGLLIQHIA